VEGYLLDTSALSPAVDPGHYQHAAAITTINSIGTAPIFVPVLALAELIYGFQLYQKSTGVILPDAEKMLTAAKLWPPMAVTHHTAPIYAELKAALAVYCMPNVTRQFRKRHVEDWINQFTCKTIGVDDNDLWICAQARESNFVLVRGDKKMDVINNADPLLKLMLIGETV
jgi:predicted nucleic acid-binding protein